MRFLVTEVEVMAAQRPAGYVDDVLDHGTVEGDWFSIDDGVLAKLRVKYGKPVTPREWPAASDEVERCRSICANCPGKHYRPEIDYCDDPDCGCIVAEDRRDPALNRKTQCKYWLPAQTLQPT